MVRVTLASAVDRTVEKLPLERHWSERQWRRRDHAVEAEPGDERRGLSMAVRKPHPQPFAPAAAPVGAGHVRRRPGLVDEDEPLGIEIGLRLEPGAALAQDVRALLFDSVPGLFFLVSP